MAGTSSYHATLAAFLLLVCNVVVHSFVSIHRNHRLDRLLSKKSMRLDGSSSKKNEEDYRAELRAIAEKQTQNAVVDALFSSSSFSVSDQNGADGSLMPVQLVGQARVLLSRNETVATSKSNEKVVTLVLTNQQRTTSSLSRISSPSSSLMVPLDSRRQLKLVSFAAAQRPLSKSVLLGLNPLFVNRDNALFDNLPWSSWSIDPSERNRDAAGNFIESKFHLGKRDAYNRFMGRDWQGKVRRRQFVRQCLC